VVEVAEEKSKGGRPRKYASNAERQRAYYERKKKKVKELEEEVKKLKTGTIDKRKKSLKPLKIEDAMFSWEKITPGEIALMGMDELKQIATSFSKKIVDKSALREPLFNLILVAVNTDFSSTSEELTSEKIFDQLNPEIDQVIQHLRENIQRETLLYLLEAEIASRDRIANQDSRIDTILSEINELKKVVKEQELKIKRS
jgi:hypothetical protein